MAATGPRHGPPQLHGPRISTWPQIAGTGSSHLHGFRKQHHSPCTSARPAEEEEAQASDLDVVQCLHSILATHSVLPTAHQICRQWHWKLQRVTHCIFVHTCKYSLPRVIGPAQDLWPLKHCNYQTITETSSISHPSGLHL